MQDNVKFKLAKLSCLCFFIQDNKILHFRKMNIVKKLNSVKIYNVKKSIPWSTKYRFLSKIIKNENEQIDLPEIDWLQNNGITDKYL